MFLVTTVLHTETRSAKHLARWTATTSLWRYICNVCYTPSGHKEEYGFCSVLRKQILSNPSSQTERATYRCMCSAYRVYIKHFARYSLKIILHFTENDGIYIYTRLQSEQCDYDAADVFKGDCVMSAYRTILCPSWLNFNDTLYWTKCYLSVLSTVF